MYPILFHIGHFSLHTYGVMLMLAFIAAIGRAFWYIKKHPEKTSPILPEDALDMGIWLMVCGIAGARLLFVILNWGGAVGYGHHPLDALKIWEGGLSFHGALIGGIPVIAYYCRTRKVSFLRVADVAAPSVLIGYIIGRLGCFFNGCCYGGPTNLPWGVRFQDVDPVTHQTFMTPPSHPAQLYASLLSLIFLFILFRVEKRKTMDGQVLVVYILMAAIERFIMEIFRAGTTATVVALGLTQAQWLCVVLAVGAIFSLLALRSRAAAPKGNPTPA